MPHEDPDRLTADDAHILSVESPAIAGHTLKLIVLEPGGAPLDLDGLRTEVAQRLPSQRRATQRIDVSGPNPRWVATTAFDIDDHVRRHEVADCVSTADLWRAVSALMSEHLDRGLPLWTFDLIGPLADGREAIAARIHHAMADGISALRFLDTVLWDPHTAATDNGSHPGIRADTAKPSPLDEVLRLPGAVHRELGHRGSHSPFDRPICAARELAFTVAPLAELKAIGVTRPLHATVNDVLAGSAEEFSLSISNVPGPVAPVSVAGRRVEHMFSSSEPAAHHALRISAISCAGIVGIGLCTDPDALPDVAGLAGAIDHSYAELRSTAIV